MNAFLRSLSNNGTNSFTGGRKMFKRNGGIKFKVCPKCRKERQHYEGYDFDNNSIPMALDKCSKCGHESDWDEEGELEDES